MKHKSKLNNIKRLELIRVKRSALQPEKTMIKIFLSERRQLVVRRIDDEREHNLAFSKKAWAKDRVQAFMVAWRNTAISRHMDFEVDEIVLAIFGNPFANLKHSGAATPDCQPQSIHELVSAGGLVTHSAEIAGSLLLVRVG